MVGLQWQVSIASIPPSAQRPNRQQHSVVIQVFSHTNNQPQQLSRLQLLFQVNCQHLAPVVDAVQACCHPVHAALLCCACLCPLDQHSCQLVEDAVVKEPAAHSSEALQQLHELCLTQLCLALEYSLCGRQTSALTKHKAQHQQVGQGSVTAGAAVVAAAVKTDMPQEHSLPAATNTAAAAAAAVTAVALTQHNGGLTPVYSITSVQLPGSPSPANTVSRKGSRYSRRSSAAAMMGSS